MDSITDGVEWFRQIHDQQQQHKHQATTVHNHLVRLKQQPQTSALNHGSMYSSVRASSQISSPRTHLIQTQMTNRSTARQKEHQTQENFFRLKNLYRQNISQME